MTKDIIIDQPFQNNQQFVTVSNIKEKEKKCETQLNNKHIYLLIRSHSTCRYKQGN